MKNGGVGWDVNLPVKIFSLLTYSSHLQLQNTSNRGFSRLGVFRNTSNPSFSCLEVFQNASNPRFSRWKPRKTVIRVEWRLSGVVAALLYNFSSSSFSKQFLLKKNRETGTSLREKETETRGNDRACFNLLGRMSKPENILLNCLTIKFFGQIFLTSLPKGLTQAGLPLLKFIVMCHLNLSHLTNC